MRTHFLSLAAALLLATLLLAPVPEMPLVEDWATFPGIDKLVHVALFFLASGAWLRSAVALGLKRPAAVTVCAATVYAGALELAQMAFTASRSGEWLDLAAGTLGALAAVGLAGALGRRERRSEKARDFAPS